MVGIFLAVHKASGHCGLDAGKIIIQCGLGTAGGFKSQWPRYTVGFLAPFRIIPAGRIDNLDFVSHGLFKTQNSRAGKFALAKVHKPGQVYDGVPRSGPRLWEHALTQNPLACIGQIKSARAEKPEARSQNVGVRR